MIATIIQIVGALVIAVLLAALDGVLIFFPVAAVAGFLGWIFGAPSPRDVALTAGCIIGGVWAVAALFLKLGSILGAIGKHLSQKRLEALEIEGKDGEAR